MPLKRTPPHTPKDNANTSPVLVAAESNKEGTGVTARKKRPRVESPKTSSNQDIDKILETFKNEIREMLVTWKEEQNLVLNKLVTDITDLKLQCTTIQKSNSDIQEAMIYINKDYEEMRNKVALLGKEHEEYTKAHSYPDLAKDESGVNVTHRKRKQPECELTVAISELSREVKKNITELRADINNQFLNINMNIASLREEFNTLSSATSQISNDVKELRTEFSTTKIDVAELQSQYAELCNEISELKSSVNFNAENYNDGVKRIADMEARISHSEAANIAFLENRIDVLEQQARQFKLYGKPMRRLPAAKP
ncbi:unnamed protein product [Arctia plantaginis]|uniref:Uncharacterized protein n=1 Tax=Arctia plantaginis TaxID=874455 RepID=A0A8S1BDK3_ARCPL|nr:unnamed protein product [Arctia plantaginis]